MDNSDLFHKEAVFVFQKILEHKDKVKIIIPSLVFYETIVTLIKKNGMSRKEIEDKLWRFLYHDSVMNVALIETSAFKASKKISNASIINLRTQDFIIANIGMDFDAQILTFDKKMRDHLSSVYKEIYYCADTPGINDDTPDFLTDFYNKIGVKRIETFEDIPF